MVMNVDIPQMQKLALVAE